MPKPESFSPLLLDLMKRGAQERVEVETNDPKKAQRLRFRLHQLRKAHRLARTPHAPILEGAKVSIVGKTKVRIEPVDSDLVNLIPVVETEAGKEEEVTNIDDYFEELMKRGVDTSE